MGNINLNTVIIHRGFFTLPIKATETGVWAFMTTFNGAYQYLQFEAKEGDFLVIPVRLNDDYTYTCKIYTPDNQIFNKTNYTFKTKMYDPEMLSYNLIGDYFVDYNVIPKFTDKSIYIPEMLNSEQFNVFVDKVFLKENYYSIDHLNNMITFKDTVSIDDESYCEILTIKQNKGDITISLETLQQIIFMLFI